MKNKFRTAYQKRDRQSFNTVGETMTDQSQKDSTDIKNNRPFSILVRFGGTPTLQRGKTRHIYLSFIGGSHHA